MEKFYLTGCSLLRLRRTLGNPAPLPAETKTSVQQDDSVCAFLPERHKNPVILLILSKSILNFKSKTDTKNLK